MSRENIQLTPANSTMIYSRHEPDLKASVNTKSKPNISFSRPNSQEPARTKINPQPIIQQKPQTNVQLQPSVYHKPSPVLKIS